jgi:hypothetical protein
MDDNLDADVQDFPVYLVVIPFPSEFHADYALEDITRDYAYRGCVVKSTMGKYADMIERKD